MSKIDYKKSLGNLYRPSAEAIEFVDVPSQNFLAVTGKGKPEGVAYQQALQALFPVAYKIKFWIKENKGFDYVVPPLEGLWWADDLTDFKTGNRDAWRWTMMIMQPDLVTQRIVTESLDRLADKKNPLLALNKVEFQTLAEGRCAQILHIGPFSEEGPVIERLHLAFEREGARLTG